MKNTAIKGTDMKAQQVDYMMTTVGCVIVQQKGRENVSIENALLLTNHRPDVNVVYISLWKAVQGLSLEINDACEKHTLDASNRVHIMFGSEFNRRVYSDVEYLIKRHAPVRVVVVDTLHLGKRSEKVAFGILNDIAHQNNVLIYLHQRIW